MYLFSYNMKEKSDCLTVTVKASYLKLMDFLFEFLLIHTFFSPKFLSISKLEARPGKTSQFPTESKQSSVQGYFNESLIFCANNVSA